MRFLCLAILTGLSAAGTVAAQSPAGSTQPTAPALDPNRGKLDEVLLRWEREMKNVQTLWAECSRTELDKVFKTRKIYTGTAKFMKPNLALLEMHMQNRREVYERYLCTGTHLFIYYPERKQIRARELPKPKLGQASEDNLMSFLFGMKADEAKRRYDLSLAQEDTWYYYIHVLPRTPDDKAEFKMARIVLIKDRMLPAQIWFVENNDNEVTWDIPKIESNAPGIKRMDFMYPTNLPPGWTMVTDSSPKQISPRTDVEPKPRIIRPND